jgi:hypothetical protein
MIPDPHTESQPTNQLGKAELPSPSARAVRCASRLLHHGGKWYAFCSAGGRGAHLRLQIARLAQTLYPRKHTCSQACNPLDVLLELLGCNFLSSPDLAGKGMLNLPHEKLKASAARNSCRIVGASRIGGEINYYSSAGVLNLPDT